MRIQVVIDCTDAITLARWWADALDWEVEWLDPDLFAALEAQGHCTRDDVIEVDGRLSWREGAAIDSGEAPLPQHRFYFQQVPEPRTVKNRVHVDLHVGADERDALVDRMVAKGATRLADGRQGPHTWVVLRDPEGNEFCVA
jgi:hypothetical protein